MSPINNRTGFQAQSDTIKSISTILLCVTESSHVSAPTPFGSPAFVISHQCFHQVLSSNLQILTSWLSNDTTFSWVHKQVRPGNISGASSVTILLIQIQLSGFFLWNQPTLLLTIHAVSSTTTSHIDFSLKMMDSSSHDSLSAGSRSPPMLFFVLFNSLQKCLRATPDCHRPHDRYPPSSTGPAWPVKSRRSRATLELSQLLEQMSLRSSSVRTARRHRERELRVQNYSWLCVFSLWILGFIYLFFTFVQFLQYGVSRFMPGELHKDTCWDARLQVSRRGIWRIQLHFKWIKIIKLIISINLFFILSSMRMINKLFVTHYSVVLGT